MATNIVRQRAVVHRFAKTAIGQRLVVASEPGVQDLSLNKLYWLGGPSVGRNEV
jgi:hypothetical protein